MDKMLKITAIAVFIMGSQFITAQQNPASLQASRNSKENHKMITDRISGLKNEQQQMELKRNQPNATETDKRKIDERIAQLRTEQQSLEAKNNQLPQLEASLNATNDEISKLEADQDAEYKNNSSTSDPAILKQRTDRKEKINNLYQLQQKQQMEIIKAMKTP